MNSIRFVPTAVHGIFDYVGAAALIASPFIFRFSSMGGIAVILAIVLGAGLFLYSLLTNYELGIPAWRVIPMQVHLTVDFAAAALLAVAPFLFGYSSLGLNIWLPQVIAGVAVILLVLVSQTEPQKTYVRRSESVDLPGYSKRRGRAAREELRENQQRCSAHPHSAFRFRPKAEMLDTSVVSFMPGYSGVNR